MTSDAWQDWNDAPRALSMLETLELPQLKKLMRTPFLLSARPAQRPPSGLDWRTWLFMGGRGAGKTRAGAEFLQYAICRGGYKRAALVGPTLHDVREVMIEGPSGLIEVAAEKEDRPTYQPSRRRVIWPNGGEAHVFSAEDPDSLRGPQFDIAWCDEIAAWPRGEDVWDMLQMALRLGDHPRVMASTTPRPVPLVKRLLGDESVQVTRSATADNAANLAPDFLEALERQYGGSRLARQEIDGELIEDPDGALWTRSGLDAVRVLHAPELQRIVVAVDLPASEGPKADTCGIIGAGLVCIDGVAPKAYVIADASAQGLSPLSRLQVAVLDPDEIGLDLIWQSSGAGGMGDATSFSFAEKRSLPYAPGHVQRAAIDGIDQLSWVRRTPDISDAWRDTAWPNTGRFRIEVFRDNQSHYEEEVEAPMWPINGNGSPGDRVEICEIGSDGRRGACAAITL
ncbi:MAG: terminase family protein [Pseudomonadota bacterium]